MEKSPHRDRPPSREKKYLQEDIRSKQLTDDAPVARKLVKRKLK